MTSQENFKLIPENLLKIIRIGVANSSVLNRDSLTYSFALFNRTLS